MASIAIDNNISIVQIRAQWTLGVNGAGESSWSFIMPRAAGDSRVLVLAAWEAFLMDKFAAARSGFWTLRRVLAEDRWPHVLATYVDDVELSPPIDDGSPGMPPQLSALISWRTGDVGRRNRGRTFMGPYTTLSIEQDNVVDPALSAVYDFAEAMLAHFGPGAPVGQPRFAIVSAIPDGPLAPFGHYSLVTNYYFLEEWATERRRMRYSWRT